MAGILSRSLKWKFPFRSAMTARLRNPLRMETLEDRSVPAIMATGVPTWLEAGPSPIGNSFLIDVPGTPPNQSTGAVEDILPHPTDPNILFAGGVNGGIWRTMNALDPNPTWTPLTDQLPTLSVGTMDMNPSNPNQILVGIGAFSAAARVSGDLLGAIYTENALDPTPTFRVLADPLLINQDVYGVIVRDNYMVVAGTGGLFRSVDNGATWTTLSGTGGLPIGGLNDTWYLDAQADPANPNRVYVSSDSGIFRTDNILDPSPSWSNITIPEMNIIFAGTVQAKLSIHDSPGNNIVYLGVVNNSRLDNVHWSADLGQTWTRMDDATLLGAPEPIFNATNATPIAITSPFHGLFDGAQVFVSGVEGNPAANGLWTVTVVDANTFSLNGSVGTGVYVPGTGTYQYIFGPHPGAQGEIHFSFRAHPTNPNLIYLAGDRQDGAFPNSAGATTFTSTMLRGDRSQPRTFGVFGLSPQWTPVTDNFANGTAPYPDSRDIRFDANGTLIEGSDGGVFRRSDPTSDSGSWSAAIGNLGLGQIYQVRYDIQNNVLFGGMQDTGSPAQVSGAGDAGSRTWVSTLPGDGFWQGVDNISGASKGLTLRYSMGNTIETFSRLTYDNTNTLVGKIQRVFLSSPTDPTPYSGLDGSDKGSFGLNVFTVNAVEGKQLMIAMQKLYEDDNPLDGNAGDTIANVTPAGYSGVGTAVAYGGKQNGFSFPRIAYVGTSAGQLFIRGAAGGFFQAKTLPGSGPVNDISMDPDNWRNAYVLRGNNVYQTTDGGITFTDLTANLVGSNFDNAGNITDGLTTRLTSLTIYDVTPNVDDGKLVVIVGANNGVFRYVPDLVDPNCSQGPWMRFGAALPNAIIDDLQIYGNRLIAGTNGRGAWVIPDISADIGSKAEVVVMGNDGDNAMSLTSDPSNSNYIIVNDGLGNVQTLPRSAIQSIVFRGLGGADTITIEGNTGQNGDLRFVQFPVTIDAGGDTGDSLVIRNAGRTTPSRLTITANQIGGGSIATSGEDDNFFGATCGTQVLYSGLENGNLIVDLGESSPGGNTVLVQSTSAANTSILGSKANDEFILNSIAGLGIDGNLASIAGDVSIDGRGGGDGLTISDRGANAGNSNVLISGSAITGMTGSSDAGSVNYSNIQTLIIQGSDNIFGTESYTIADPSANLTLLTNNGPDTVNLRANTLGLDIQTGAGNDIIRLSSEAGLNDNGSLGLIQGPVSIDAGGGSNRLVLSNFGNASPGVYVIGSQTISGPTNNPISYFATGGNFSNGASGDGILLRGSNLADDAFTIESNDAGNQLTVEGNGGKDLFTLNGQTLAGEIALRGGEGDDNFRVLSGLIGNQAKRLLISGGPGSDTAQVQGFSTKNDVSFITVTTPTSGFFAGLGNSFDFDTLATVNYDALGGRNRLTITNATPTGLGSVADPGAGVVYLATGGESGQITMANGTVGPTLVFSNINGADGDGLVFSGNPTAGAPNDTLTVLGFSTVGEPTGAGTLKTSTSRDGSDIINVSDQLVSVRNSVLGYMRPIAIAQVNGRPSVANIVVLGGNESTRFGDQFKVTPSQKTNIFIDGQGPGTVPGDRLTINSTESTQLNSTFDTSLSRPVSQVITPSGASFTFQRFENTGLVGNYFAVGADIGGGPRVVVYDSVSKARVFDQFVYSPDFTGGVRVAMGDVTGDGIPDLITAAGIGGGPHIQIFDGLTFNLVSSFFAYENSFRGGLFVAVGDIDGDGKAEIATGTGSGGGPLVRVFDVNGKVITGFFAYNSSFRGGVRIAVGDINGDGIGDIVTGAGPGGGPHVKVFSGNDLTMLYQFMSGDSNAGVYVAAGDLDGDGAAEVASAPGGNDAPIVTIRRSRDGSLIQLSIFDIGIAGPDGSLPTAPPNTLTAQGAPVAENTGVRLAIAPFDPQSGRNRLIASRGAGYVPRITAYGIDPLVEVGNFLPFEENFEGGVFVG